jgi:hypothetical protein
MPITGRTNANKNGIKVEQMPIRQDAPNVISAQSEK